jgi:hypothetical protein
MGQGTETGLANEKMQNLLQIATEPFTEPLRNLFRNLTEPFPDPYGTLFGRVTEPLGNLCETSC